MKKAFKIASFCLSLLILFNSVGIAVFEHTCNFKNETARSLYKMHSCCAKKENTKNSKIEGISFKKTKCCETNSSVFVPNVFQSTGVDFKFSQIPVTVIDNVFFPAFLSVANAPAFLRFSDCSGPPLSVRTSINILFQVFVI
jgi:hypothetical protein